MVASEANYHFPSRSLLPRDPPDRLDCKKNTTDEAASCERLLDMATCEVCENEYDKAFEVIVAGKRHTFDSFECAIHALAPVCPHCHCRVVGHGVEADGQIFCCVHCARTAGKTQLKDRA